jgi:maltooligosyltrehalose trehalohydrolase
MAAGQQRLRLVQQLLTVRRREIVPRLAGAAFGDAHAAENGLLTARWRLGDGAALHLTANLSDQAIGPLTGTKGTTIWGVETGSSITPWSVSWRLEPRS